eukprot:CAMPEP_0113504140 /NCGR_PEP_ID=MMETSP0014_2-20120614/34558_1 /TAXON_ID=2857 /ORGANISM="Nitzschia sp." /LENGTH=167 /DNA_ID=CAMNT_0000399233 /DNA_START=905 /DNA_END=1409 /DNA_ORIENTATION=+ /assembly_acc=CAM_ASM_000159
MPTIAEIACGLDDFSTLCAAVVAAGLDGALAGDGPFTVFAPTNEAFAALPDGTVEFLVSPEGIPTLTDILLYHVVSGAFFAEDLVTPAVCAGGGDVGLTTTLLEKDVRTICCHSCDPAEKIFVKGAGNPREGNGSANANQDIWPQLVATDVEACNGVIHVVNNVILP